METAFQFFDRFQKYFQEIQRISYQKKSQDLCSNFMYYLLLVHHVLLITVITHSAS